jgi:hypothetical protein
MSLQEADKEAGAVAVAPRVSLADIEGAIAARYDSTAATMLRDQEVLVLPALDRLSICILVMQNGFVIVGKSAPAAAANFNAALGRKLAYEDAIRQLWPLMGFALCDQLARG